MKLVATAGLQWDKAILDYLVEGDHRIERKEDEFHGGVSLSITRPRPPKPRGGRARRRHRRRAKVARRSRWHAEIGVDTGGTFTDLVMLGTEGADRAQGAIDAGRSLPRDPEGIEETRRPRRRVDVVHGSTVATNAVLERKGARVALVATAGFEDVLRIGRQTRRELYNLMRRRPRVRSSTAG